jgi:hypothetical protein
MEVLFGLALIVGGAWAFLQLLTLATEKRPVAVRKHTSVDQHALVRQVGATPSATLLLDEDVGIASASHRREHSQFIPHANVDGTPMLDNDFDAKGNALGTAGW